MKRGNTVLVQTPKKIKNIENLLSSEKGSEKKNFSTRRMSELATPKRNSFRTSLGHTE